MFQKLISLRKQYHCFKATILTLSKEGYDKKMTTEDFLVLEQLIDDLYHELNSIERFMTMKLLERVNLIMRDVDEILDQIGIIIKTNNISLCDTSSYDSFQSSEVTQQSLVENSGFKLGEIYVVHQGGRMA